MVLLGRFLLFSPLESSGLYIIGSWRIMMATVAVWSAMRLLSDFPIWEWFFFSVITLLVLIRDLVNEQDQWTTGFRLHLHSTGLGTLGSGEVRHCDWLAMRGKLPSLLSRFMDIHNWVGEKAHSFLTNLKNIKLHVKKCRTPNDVKILKPLTLTPENG